MTDPIRLALVGCGRQMGQNLVPFLQRLEGHRIVACVDDVPTLARAMQARTGAAHAVADVRELDLDGVDAAVIAVPPQPSSALTRYFVERGISCFVEKPGGESTAVLDALCEAERRSEAHVQVGFNFRYAEALQQLHGLTHLTRATPSTVSIGFFSRHPETPQWGVDSTVEAWIRQNGVHAIDLARWFQPAPVSKIDVHLILRDPDHFFATILLRHADGSLSVLRVGNHVAKFVVDASVQGGDGSVYTAPSLEQVLLELDAGTPSRRLLHSTRNLDHGWARSGFGPELEAFLAACRSKGSGSPDRPSLVDALEASRICDRVMAELADASVGHEAVDGVSPPLERSPDPSAPMRTARWVVAQLLPERRLLAIFLVAAVASNLAAAFVPFYTGRAFAAATAAATTTAELWPVMLAVLGLIVARFAAEGVSIGAVETVAQRLKRDSRDALYRSLLRKGQSFHDRQSVGDILSRTVNDGKLLDYMVGLGLPITVNGLLAIGLSITLIASTDARLLLAPAAIAVVFGVALWHHVERVQPLSRESRVTFAAFNQTVADTLGGIATVKALAVEAHERDKVAAAAERYRRAFERRGRVQAIYLPGLSFAVGMAIGVSQSLILYGAGQLALHDVITYLGWLALFGQAITASEQAVPILQDGFVAAARVREITDAAGDEDADVAGVEAAIAGSLTFDRVSLAIAGRDVLRDVSFHLPAGATLAVTGPTGSGKSALVKLINRTYEASDGTILIDGQNVGDWRLSALRRQIATVHQDTFLFSKSVHENIAFGVGEGASRAAVEAAAEQASARDFILALEGGYETVLNEGGSTLSGGQRQRLGIARALITEPSILIMDDATSALDATTAAAVSGHVRHRMSGRTTVMVTHEPQQIGGADLILVLDAGRVVDLGSHADLSDRCALYQELYAE